MMFPQVMGLDFVCPEDIAFYARVMHDAGHTIDDCPFPEGSDAAITWRKHFIGCEQQHAEVE